MPDLPRYPVAWTVDARVPDEVRALVATLSRMDLDPATIQECREIAIRVKAMLNDLPPGKAIFTD